MEINGTIVTGTYGILMLILKKTLRLQWISIALTIYIYYELRSCRIRDSRLILIEILKDVRVVFLYVPVAICN